MLRAAEMLLRRGVVELTILGDQGRGARPGCGARPRPERRARSSIPPPRRSARRFAATYHELRKHKGVTEELAYDTVADVSYFGTLMVHAGDADGMVSGAAHTTGDTIRPAFEIIKARPGVSVVSSVFLMCLADRVLVYGDCAVNPKPDVEQLADIAISSAETAAAFGIEPLSRCSPTRPASRAKGADVDAVREATELVREAPARPKGRGADPVRRGDRSGRGREEAAGQRGGGPRDGVRLSRTSRPEISPTRLSSALQARSPSGRCCKGSISR